MQRCRWCGVVPGKVEQQWITTKILAAAIAQRESVVCIPFKQQPLCFCLTVNYLDVYSQPQPASKLHELDSKVIRLSAD